MATPGERLPSYSCAKPIASWCWQVGISNGHGISPRCSTNDSLQFSDATAQEMIEEFRGFDPSCYSDGQWVRQSAWKAKRIDFGPPFGSRYCVPMMLAELRSLPDTLPTLRETGFFIAGFNWFIDYVFMTIALIGLAVAPRASIGPLAKLFVWGCGKFGKPPFGIALMVEAAGRKDGVQLSKRFRCRHDDGYLLTAIPVAACLLQYLDGSIAKPGLWFQANVAEPKRMIRDMARMGVTFEVFADDWRPALV